MLISCSDCSIPACNLQQELELLHAHAVLCTSFAAASCLKLGAGSAAGFSNNTSSQLCPKRTPGCVLPAGSSGGLLAWTAWRPLTQSPACGRQRMPRMPRQLQPRSEDPALTQAQPSRAASSLGQGPATTRSPHTAQLCRSLVYKYTLAAAAAAWSCKPPLQLDGGTCVHGRCCSCSAVG